MCLTESSGCDDPNDLCYGGAYCCGEGGGGGGGSDPCNPSPCEYNCIVVWEYGRYQAECQAEIEDPVVVSLDGSLFPMTSADRGVRFDFYKNSKPVQVSWTAAGSKIGWLAMDRNGDGAITSGWELFSNVTPQSGDPGERLGFKALSVFDQVRYGGDGDGWIDAGDEVFSRLRVWVDRNHDGMSQSGELLTMAEAGIKAISARYEPDNWTDSFGNRFQSRARILWTGANQRDRQGGTGERNRWAYDVILVHGASK